MQTNRESQKWAWILLAAVVCVLLVPGVLAAAVPYTPPDGVVFINSVPPGATIYIGEKPMGVTDTSVHLKQGTYVLRLAKEGYEDDISTFSIGSGDAIMVSRTLKTPGFECILACVSLLTVFFIVRNRKT
jgi:hypothetical protein